MIHANQNLLGQPQATLAVGSGVWLGGLIEILEKRAAKYQLRAKRAGTPANRIRWGIKCNTTRECLNDIKKLYNHVRFQIGDGKTQNAAKPPNEKS